MRAKARIFSELGAKARILFRTTVTKKNKKNKSKVITNHKNLMSF